MARLTDTLWEELVAIWGTIMEVIGHACIGTKRSYVGTAEIYVHWYAKSFDRFGPPV